jgi:formiminotetrahydrofolate cyclodeaminase
MSTPLRDQSVQSFLDQLASSSPTPGGGSVAALTGALAAGLISMVCQLTVGRPRYAAFEAEAQAILAQSEAIRARLTDLIQIDVAAYSTVAAAYKLPKDDPTRTAAIAAAMVVATDVPLQIAEQAAALLPLALPVAQQGNRTAVGDVVAGAQLAVACVHAALINVDANVGLLADHPGRDAFVARQEAARAGIEAQRDAIVTVAMGRL